MTIRAIVLVVGLAGVGALVVQKLQHTSFNQANKVFVSKAHYADVKAALFVSGTVSYATQARLSAEVVAKVTDILVQEGEQVAAGQVLLQLDDTEINKEIEQAGFVVERAKIDERTARRQLDNKQLNYSRLQQLSAQRFVQKFELDQAKVELDLAAIAVDAAVNELRQRQTELSLSQSKAAKTSIRAPISGVVMSIPIKKGETAVASAHSISGSELLFLADPQSYQVEAFISEFDLARVALHQPVKVVLRSEPGLAMTGKIIKVGAVLQQNNEQQNLNGVQVLISFDNQAKQLIAGMNCDIEIFQSEQTATLSVPVSAIYSVQKKSDLRYVKGALTEHFVYVLVDETIEQRAVELGLADGERQEIRKGLQNNDRVVSGPAALLPELKTGSTLSALQRELVEI
ncbi:MAG: efflux RND transporter periplasmic adaptor subunit [Gammaproteobacteria bacterium]|nr:efflux RND transporter periplasmic adaptor subunit [Gammaproteobacteria bacterium]